MTVTDEAEAVSKAIPARMTSRRALPHLWSWRVVYAGLLAIALAMLGEAIMRAQPGILGLSPAVGTALVQIAALLTGLVAWVHDGPRTKRAHNPSPPPETGSDTPAVLTRPARSHPSASSVASQEGFIGRLARNAQRFPTLRAHLGWRGTLAGLVVVALLALWLGLLLRVSFRDPLAPWIWLAMLCALALTFAGVRPWPAGSTLLPHDPAEPRVEPAVSRREWLIVAAIILTAAALRLVNLENIPVGPYIDEFGRSARRALAQQGPAGSR